MTEYWGGTRHFFLLTLYNFKILGGTCSPCPPSPPSPTPRSLLPDKFHEKSPNSVAVAVFVAKIRIFEISAGTVRGGGGGRGYYRLRTKERKYGSLDLFRCLSGLNVLKYFQG